MTDEGRTPPQDNDAEMAVLGAMLLSSDAIGEASAIVRGSDFYLPNHEEIYDVIVELYTAGEPVDSITVSAALGARGILGKIGGAPYLHTLTADPNMVPARAEQYAHIVRGKAILRRLIDAGSSVVQMGYAGLGDPYETVDAAQAKIAEAVPQRDHEDYLPIGDLMAQTLDEIDDAAKGIGSLDGVPTGFVDLDELTGGLHPGQMVIIGARPAVGKSTLGVDFLRSASIRHHMTSAIFSLEMNRTELTLRVISAQAKVSLQKLRDPGSLSESDWVRIGGAMAAIQAAPLFIDDSPNMTMTEIRAKARKLKRDHDLRLLVIDYLQLMTSGRKVENRQVEVSEFARQIKLLAKELEIPVVALSQLNRGVEGRSDKRPLLSDLRESGSLEQDADVVVLLHRPDMDGTEESTRPGEADLIVAKQRNGPTQTVTVAFQGHYSRFVDMAQPGWGAA